MISYPGSPSVMELLKVLSTDLKAQPGDSEIAPLFLCSGRGTERRGKTGQQKKKKGTFSIILAKARIDAFFHLPSSYICSE